MHQQKILNPERPQAQSWKAEGSTAHNPVRRDPRVPRPTPEKLAVLAGNPARSTAKTLTNKGPSCTCRLVWDLGPGCRSMTQPATGSVQRSSWASPENTKRRVLAMQVQSSGLHRAFDTKACKTLS